MPRCRRLLRVVGWLSVFWTAAAAGGAGKDTAKPALRFAKIFTDHMVLQQGKPLVVWGWAEPGAKVKVTVTQDGSVGEAAMAKLADERPTARSGQADDGAYAVAVRYVETNPPKLPTRAKDVQAGPAGRWTARFAPAKASFQPTWIVAASGGDLVGVRDVLIGEVWLCAGQSNMVWGNFNRKDREAASADFPALRYVAWDDSWYKPLDDVRANIAWRVCSPTSAERFSAVPYLYGMFLHRYLKVPVGIINVARGGTLGQAWCLREELDRIDHVIVKTVLKDYDAETATWDDPKKVEAILAEWTRAVEKAEKDYETKAAAAKAEGKKPPRRRLPRKPGDPRRGWSPPAGLFNATVLPIRQLGLRGVLYYQGENNNFMRWTRYEHTFPKVPVSFRKAFGDETLAFGCISQPGWGTFGLDPETATIAEGYAIVRDIQRRALAGDDRAALIATYPTGNSYIHPAEKLPVAEYASLWALATVYDKPVVHRGTTFREMKIVNGKGYLFFDVDPIVQKMVQPGKEPPYWLVLPCPRQGKAPLEGFILAGKDRRWYPAKARHAKLEGKHCIEVSSDLVPEPVAVRYGWANWPTGNLVGRNRLPMPTFRTDDWPIPQGMNYTKQAEAQCREELKRLRTEAEKNALDRKIRQMQIDLPRLETELQLRKNNSPKKLIESKIARMTAILDELQTDEWLSRHIKRSAPELVEKLQAARAAIEALKAQAKTLEDKR